MEISTVFFLQNVPISLKIKWENFPTYFKNFIQEALYKDDFKDFLIPKDIYFAPINYDTGKKTNFDDPKAINT